MPVIAVVVRNVRRVIFTGLLATAVSEAVAAEIEIFLLRHATDFKGFGDHLMNLVLQLLHFFLRFQKLGGDSVVHELFTEFFKFHDLLLLE